MFELMGINNPIFINDSLCAYHKKIQGKCKMIYMNKFIYGFWVSYELKKIKMSESSTPRIITHDVDLETKQPQKLMIRMSQFQFSVLAL